MKTICLVGNTEKVFVDDEDYDWLNNYRWYLGKFGCKYYAVTEINLVPVSMHRFILNALPNIQIDHKDGNSLNNCRENLRVATSQENARNRKKIKRKCSSSYKGVIFIKSRGKFRADINTGNVRICLGYFKSEIDAAKAYDEAAIKYFGEFAKTNFSIKEGSQA